MTDIVERLRTLRYLRIPCVSKDAEEAAAEIDRLRLELSVQKACTVAGRDEIASLRLTDEEREAILTAADLLIGSKPGATLRWLLVRLRSTP
jgi:hypothetical protein